MLRCILFLFALFNLGRLGAAEISPLADKPRWPTLDRYQETITRDDFTRLLQNVYATRGYDDLIQIGDDSARIVEDAAAQKIFTLRFAKGTPPKLPAHYWRRIDKLSRASTKRPLSGLDVTLDPGHLGGHWAKMEERWVQVDDQPITPLRPDDFREIAREVLSKTGVNEPRQNYDADDVDKDKSIRWQSELLFYRQSEIRYRAKKVNMELQPDLVLCLHFNAEGWGDPKNPTLIDRNHFHVLVNGSYLPDEIAHDDERYEMIRRLLSRAYEEELPLADAMAATFAQETGLPPYQYTTDTVTKVGTSGYVYARNLLATRVFRCPVIYFEPYVMNSNEAFARIQAGDYEGTRDINGLQRPSIFREYAGAVADGLAEYCRNIRTEGRAPSQP